MRLRQETRQRVASWFGTGYRPSPGEFTFITNLLALKRSPYRLLADATGMYGGVGWRRCDVIVVRSGASAEAVGEQAAEFAALVEAHVDDLEGHVLGAIVAHEGGGLEIAQADLKAQGDRSAGRQVAADGGDAAGEAGGLDLQAAGFF